MDKEPIKQSIFFISPDISLDSPEAPASIRPSGDPFALIRIALGAYLREATGLSPMQLLDQAMSTPATPYEPTWETTDLFCPFCSAKGLLVEAGEGDYYQDPKHRCDSCKNTCYIQ